MIPLAGLILLLSAGGYLLLGREPDAPHPSLPLERKEVMVNGDVLTFLHLPAGCFSMGSPFGETHRDRDEPRHTVCLKAFWLADKEIHNALFRRFRPNHDSGAHRGLSLNGDAQPAASFSWVDGRAFLDWLGNQTGGSFRYPTEAEWEYAARAGTTRSNFWGNDAAGACAFANVHDNTSAGIFPDFNWIPHPCGDGHAVSAPVGSFAPNPWGFYDMLGNVWEWTCSGYEMNYQGGLENRCGDGEDASGERVMRGGSWVNQPSRVRAAYRKRPSLNARFRSAGLRVVMETPPPSP